MYKTMIIDDDAVVRERLKDMIDWKGLSLELVCEAGDSDTALEMYLLYRPKIIISDISIPRISGLELAEVMRREDADIQFIIITGYHDFEWAKQSVRLGAIDLLSKPVFAETINASLQKAVRYFQAKQQKKQSVDFLKNLVSENLPQMQETFMMGLLTKASGETANLEKQLRFLQIRCPGPYYVVAILAVRTLPEDMEEDVALFLLRDTLTTAMKENGFDMLALVDTHARLNCIVSTSDGNPDDQIETVITKVGEQLHFLTGMDLVSGIGPTVDRLALLHESRSGALTAVNYQCILGDSTVMHFKNMERMDMVFHSQESIHGYLKKLFRENAYATLASAVRNHVTALSGQGPKARKQIQSFLFEFMQDITGEALRLGITVERFDDYLPAMMRLLQSQEDDSVEAVLHFAERIMTSIDGHKNEESNHLILLAKKYIGEHLDDEHMCLESVSDHIGLSRIYFCKLFHKVEGISFNTYLKQERIDLAKRLLLTTNMKVYEISSAAGFSQAKYFGYVFKQVVGLTPLEYQQQNTKSTLNPS